MNDRSDVRHVIAEEVTLAIDGETDIVSRFASALIANGCDTDLAVQLGFGLLDKVLALQETRKQTRMKNEWNRRKGY